MIRHNQLFETVGGFTGYLKKKLILQVGETSLIDPKGIANLKSLCRKPERLSKLIASISFKGHFIEKYLMHFFTENQFFKPKDGLKKKWIILSELPMPFST